MTIQTTDQAAPLRWGPKPGMYVSPDLAAAFMLVVWRANPQQFGNFLKKAMAELWAENGRGPGHG